jgi:hypothetical protein
MLSTSADAVTADEMTPGERVQSETDDMAEQTEPASAVPGHRPDDRGRHAVMC